MTAGKHGVVAEFEGVGPGSGRAVERTEGRPSLVGPLTDVSEVRRKIAGGAGAKAPAAEGAEASAAAATQGSDQLAQGPGAQRLLDRLRNRVQDQRTPPQPGQEQRPRLLERIRDGVQNRDPNAPRPLAAALDKLLKGVAETQPPPGLNQEQLREWQDRQDFAKIAIGLIQEVRDSRRTGGQVAEEINLAPPIKLGEGFIDLKLLGPLKKTELDPVDKMVKAALDVPITGLFTFRDSQNTAQRVAEVKSAGVLARTGEALLLGLVRNDNSVRYLIVGKNERAELVEQVGRVVDYSKLTGSYILDREKVVPALEYGCLVASKVRLDQGIFVIPPDVSKVETQGGFGQPVKVKLTQANGSPQTHQLSDTGWSRVP